eukprot:GFUD01035002.1.p1 GENE.GFUD01035002.1~~GFUD01035002.1.p1  ORF type:complete len:302 (+),score=58.57 GFUD01035002.1:83-988(+)
MELFEKGTPVKICAPMVRYSKLAFRNLVRLYDCDLAFSPMILADSFYQSQKARDIEFTTNEGDKPLIVQLAANKAEFFSGSAELVSKYCNGVDLNCGCPQRWAWKEGIGACLINNPEFVSDVVKQTKAKISDPNFSVSVKIRIHKDISRTVDLCRQIEAAGASFITVHGRTKDQKGEPVNIEAIKIIKESVNIPVVANGDIKTLKHVNDTVAATGVDGVMAARGMLENPAMYAGFDTTPDKCVADWIRISLGTGTPFLCFHHHLIYMCEKRTSRADRRIFNSLSSTAAVLDYIRNVWEIQL